MKKTILVIAHRIPFPPDKGDKIRTYNFIRFLAEHYKVTVACIIDDSEDIKYVENLECLVSKVFYQIKLASQKKRWAASALVKGRSVTQESFYCSKLQTQIDDFIETENPDAILSFCTSTSDYLFRSRHSIEFLKKRVLLNDLIDVDSEKWRQYAEKKTGFMGWIYRREARFLRASEKQVVDLFNRVFLVTEAEKDVLSLHSPVDNVNALANGVDLNYFKSNMDDREDTGPNHKLVFSGAMDYWPNVEGAVWFVENVFPKMKNVIPDVSFVIVGRNPTDEVVALSKVDGVEVTGSVPDIRSYLSQGAICVVPLMIARGIQNKVLEAMAMGKPVVATTGAATGTQTKNGEDIIIADQEDEMANALIALLKDTVRQTRIGQNARKYVEVNHSWNSQLIKLKNLIDSGA